MAQESCNLDKDEAEILKPTSSPSPASTPPSPPPSSSSSPQPSLFLKPPHEFPVGKRKRPESPSGDASGAPCSGDPKPDEDSRPPPAKFANRCFSCRRKVGLTGFRCRCGDLFCSRHRYSDTHDCSFDYKAAGRAEIAKANPVIRAAKIIKI